MRVRPVVVADGKTAFRGGGRFARARRAGILLAVTGFAQFSAGIHREHRDHAADVVRHQQMFAFWRQ
ncbi:hypothetical protein D3C73_1592560 [compost metagenome]